MSFTSKLLHFVSVWPVPKLIQTTLRLCAANCLWLGRRQSVYRTRSISELSEPESTRASWRPVRRSGSVILRPCMSPLSTGCSEAAAAFSSAATVSCDPSWRRKNYWPLASMTRESNFDAGDQRRTGTDVTAVFRR